MRHSCLDRTVSVYSDPAMLDVAGVVKALQRLPVDVARAVACKIIVRQFQARRWPL